MFLFVIFVSTITFKFQASLLQRFDFDLQNIKHLFYNNLASAKI